MFPLGETTVTCTATNSRGLSASDTFRVWVRDTDPGSGPRSQRHHRLEDYRAADAGDRRQRAATPDRTYAVTVSCTDAIGNSSKEKTAIIISPAD